MKQPVSFADLVDLAELTAAPTSIGPAPVMQPLSTRYRAPNRVMRPGALDYRDIPSLHGNERVPFKSSITSGNKDERR